MNITKILRAAAVAVGFAAAAVTVDTSTQQDTGQAVRLDADDIGGVVSGPRGPEAGVWVIAETTELPTRFVRIVVTDDRGRYVIPDLPKASYTVWARGYGLIDSAKAHATPGQTVNLKAVVAPDTRAAARYYPAGYWFSLLEPPPAKDFPGTGPEGNGIAPGLKTQAEWLRLAKSGGCLSCHALGTPGTREIPAGLGVFDSSSDAWMRRIQSGQAGARARPGSQHDQPGEVDGSRSGDRAGAGTGDAAAVAVLRQGSDLDQQEQRAQPDVRREGACVDHVDGSPAR
jgi:hypothetical protein